MYRGSFYFTRAWEPYVFCIHLPTPFPLSILNVLFSSTVRSARHLTVTAWSAPTAPGSCQQSTISLSHRGSCLPRSPKWTFQLDPIKIEFLILRIYTDYIHSIYVSIFSDMSLPGHFIGRLSNSYCCASFFLFPSRRFFSLDDKCGPPMSGAMIRHLDNIVIKDSLAVPDSCT